MFSRVANISRQLVDAKPRLYLAIMIGPDMSGKTTFAHMAVQYFRAKYRNFYIDLLSYDYSTSSRAIYDIKNNVLVALNHMRKKQFPKRWLVLVDARNMQDDFKRYNLYQFCVKFDISFLQIYMEFESIDVLHRCAMRGLFIHPKVFENLDFYNRSLIGSEDTTQWMCYSITINKTFLSDAPAQVVRLHNFLLTCLPASAGTPWNQYLQNPLENSHPHTLQMQAGISYKDKLVHGSSQPKKKNGVKMPNKRM